jgi:hypothetical protein
MGTLEFPKRRVGAGGDRRLSVGLRRFAASGPHTDQSSVTSYTVLSDNTDPAVSSDRRLPSLIAAGSWLLPTTVVFVIVYWQTVSASGAWFYSDDWRALSPPTSVLDIFGPYNGHWVPFGRVAYAFLVAAAGLDHFEVFMTAAAVCNLALGLAIVWWLSSRVGPLLQAAIVAACLIVPYADHTVFWLGAALNLLPVAALLFWLGGVERGCRWDRAALVGGLLVAMGLGGYGLVALTGFVIATFVAGRIGEAVAASLALIVAALPQASGQLGSVPVVRAPLLQWLNTSVKDIIARLALPLVPTVLMVGFAAGLIIARQGSGRATWLRTKLSVPATSALLGCVAAMVTLVYLARGGVEPLTASRYILLATALPTLAVVSWFTVSGHASRGFTDSGRRELAIAAVVTLMVAVRVSGWYQSAVSAGNLGRSNREAVVEQICSGVSDANLAQHVETRDGLGYMQSAITTDAWSDFRRTTESRCEVGQ